MHRLIVAAVGLLMVAAPDWALALGGGEAGDLQAAPQRTCRWSFERERQGAAGAVGV